MWLFPGDPPCKSCQGHSSFVSDQTEQPVCRWFSPGQDWWVVQGWLSWQQNTYHGPMSSCLPGTREREGGEGAERERREEKEGSERKEGRKEREGEERGRRVWGGGRTLSGRIQINFIEGPCSLPQPWWGPSPHPSCCPSLQGSS